MNIVFRVDAAPQLGGGHLSRCLTLANSLKRKGARCIFVLRDHPGSLGETVVGAGFELILLPHSSGHSIDVSSYSTWVGASWDLDSAQTYEAIQRNISGVVDWIIVDHYGLDYKWEQYFCDRAIKVGVIDDLVNRRHISKFLLDQTCGRKKSEYQSLVCSDTELYVGESYCLLRNEFFEVREQSVSKRSAFKNIKNVLISFGSTDPTGHTLLALRGLSHFANSRDIEVSILIGGACPHLNSIKDLILQLTYKVKLYVNCEHVAEVIMDADVAIGAAGVSTWERCYLGLPTLLIQTAKNQAEVVNRVISSGAAMGYFKDLEDGPLLSDALMTLEKQHKKLSKLALEMNISDGLEDLISLF